MHNSLNHKAVRVSPEAAILASMLCAQSHGPTLPHPDTLQFMPKGQQKSNREKKKEPKPKPAPAPRSPFSPPK